MADPRLLGYGDRAPLLGRGDGARLVVQKSTVVEGEFDTSASPLGGPVADRVYLVTATLYPDWANQGAATGAASSSAVAEYPVASFPVAGAPPGGGTAGGSPLELRYASRDFISVATDPDLPSAWFDGRVIDPGSINLTLPLSPVGRPAIEASVGRIVIDNTDGAFDTALDQSTAISQAVLVRAGRLGIDIADFVTVFTGRITGIGLSETELALDLQDPVLYAQNAYPTTIYTGLGADAGDPELAGIVKPVVLGRVWNMSPALINAVKLIYQAHDGAMAAVSGVFDGGVALTFAANYASYTALSGATVSAGQYATCLAAGLIRVGGTPAYALTAHVDGNSAAGTTVRSIATWLVGQLGGQAGLVVDSASFAALPLWQAGWVWTDGFSFADALNRFASDGGYSWGADSDGAIRAIALTEPGAPVATYGTADVTAIERVALPSGYEGIHQRRQVRYRRNWTLQGDGSTLAAGAVDRAGRQREWKLATATVANASRNAIDPEIAETSLYVSADATSLASTLIGLHGVPRRMFSVETTISGSLPKLGDTWAVAYPRFGLGDGTPFRVVAVNHRLADSATRLLLWG